MSKTQSTKAAAKAKTVNPVIATLAAMQAPVPTPNAFSAFVASQAAHTKTAEKAVATTVAKTSTPDVGVAVQQAAKEGFQHTEHNGRKDYQPHTIGKLIWDTADKLQAVTPNTPVTSAAVRIALPHVKPASVSAGLSHWRAFHGTKRAKAVTIPVGQATEMVGPPVPPWLANRNANPAA